MKIKIDEDEFDLTEEQATQFTEWEKEWQKSLTDISQLLTKVKQLFVDVDNENY
jgi:hypothetical protein